MKRTSKSLQVAILAATTTLFLVACDSSDNSPGTPQVSVEPVAETSLGDAEFEVQVTNLTNAQPMSPVAIILHEEGFNSFIDGEPASNELELMAEGGDNSGILSEARSDVAYIDSVSTAAPVPPRSNSAALTLSVPEEQLNDVRLSVMTMLVHTNDAFTGANAFNISNMSIGEQRVINAPTWDAGTEENTEQADTMPGPDFGGEGFNPTRLGDLDRVRFHQGVVTNASVESGLASSDLSERHRFDNPSSRIVITRVR